MKPYFYMSQGDSRFAANRESQKLNITLIGFLRFLIFLFFSAFVVIALSSCGSSDFREGVSGGVSYIDPDTGAKAGLEYQGGDLAAYARHLIRDSETGKVIGSININKVLTREPAVIAEK